MKKSPDFLARMKFIRKCISFPKKAETVCFEFMFYRLVGEGIDKKNG